MLKQRLVGLALIAIGIITAVVTNGDLTVSVLLVPLGLYTLFTKYKIVD